MSFLRLKTEAAPAPKICSSSLKIRQESKTKQNKKDNISQSHFSQCSEGLKQN
jgi:hypothetical protein